MYKCPYQIITIEEDYGYGIKHTEQKFSDCLLVNCPWWKMEERYNTGLVIPGCCMRVSREIQKK